MARSGAAKITGLIRCNWIEHFRMDIKSKSISTAVCGSYWKEDKHVDMKSTPLKVPQTRFLLDKVEVVFDVLPESRFPEAVDMFEEAAKKGDGVGADEFKDRQDILKKLQTGSRYYVYHKENNNIIALFLHYESPLQRSEKPIYNSGYIIVGSKYRSQGYGGQFMSYVPDITTKYGFKGVLGRTATVARTLVPLKKVHANFVGVLPCSILHPTEGHLDDLVILHRPRDKTGEVAAKLCEEPKIPSLSEVNEDPPWFKYQLPFPSRSLQLPNGSEIKLEPVQRRHIKQLHHMIQDFAKAGDGFALDEFDENGHFNQKFFCDFNVGIATRPGSNEDIFGAILFGKSTLMRSWTSKTAHLYILIKHVYRSRGGGRTLIEASFKLLQEMGYERIISDIYLTNSIGLALSKKTGFSITGSLPDCGYIANNGLCDSIIIHKELNISDKAVTSKI